MLPDDNPAKKSDIAYEACHFYNHALKKIASLLLQFLYKTYIQNLPISKTTCFCVVYIFLTIIYSSNCSSICSLCDEGTFCFSESLKYCPGNSTSPLGSFNIKNCSCNAGFYQNMDFSCSLCGKGNFCIGDGTATPCADHETTVTPYSTTQSECVCTAGYFVSNSVCIGCAAGKYKNFVGNGACLECPINTFNDNIKQDSVNSCTQCPSNSSSSSGSNSISSCVCNAGFERLSNVCSVCNPGYYENDGVCLACEKAKFNTLKGETVCEHCPSNTYTVSTASISIQNCLCSPGYELQAINSEDFSCKACASGKFERNGFCKNCNTGKYQPEINATSCVDCPSNSNNTDPGSNSKSDCLCGPGYAHDGENCVVCTAGSYKSGYANTGCESCQSGKYNSVDGESACLDCPLDTYQDVDGQTSCKECTANSISNEASVSIEECLCIEGFAATVNECISCSRGKYKTTVENTDCIYCPDGKTTTSNTSSSTDDCIDCPFNAYAHKNVSQVCKACPEYSSSYSGSHGIGTCSCKPGYTLDTTLCVQCELGKYKMLSGSAPCINCPAGSEGNADSHMRTNIGVCSECDAGKFELDNVCNNCPENSNSLVGMNSISSCTCNAGYEQAGEDVCDRCEPGFYNFLVNSACQQCPVGSYSAEYNATECTICPNGSTTSGLGSNSIDSCLCDGTLGYAGDCHTCEGGCQLCVQGKYLSDKECIGCPEGQYYPVQMPPFVHPRCAQCKQHMNSQVDSYGLSECFCIPGYNRKNSSFCAECERNYYCPDQSTTLECPGSSVSDQAAAMITDCTCPAGFFGKSGTSCSVCGIDKYCLGGENESFCTGNSSTEGLSGRRKTDDCICNPGWYKKDNICLRCPVDSYCFSDLFHECPPNSIARRGSDNILNCKCNAGLRLETILGVACQLCPSDVLCRGGYNEIVQCAEGSSVYHNQTCLCPGGDFCSKNGSNSCDYAETCITCPAGSFCNQNAQYNCRANSSSPVGSSNVASCVCLDGWYLSDGNCVKCPLHHYCTNDLKIGCDTWDVNLVTDDHFNFHVSHCACAEGYFRNNKNDTCKLCPKNFYCPSETITALPNVFACLENEYTQADGSTTSSQCYCNAGHKLSPEEGIMKCLPCAEGERCLQGEIQESMCHLNHRVVSQDHSQCECIEGFYEDEVESCRPCALGYIKPEHGNGQCTPCPQDTYSFNSTTCVRCPLYSHSAPASFSCSCQSPRVGDSRYSCDLCPVNSFYEPGSSEYMTGSCLQCPSNSSSDFGSSQILDCKCEPGFIGTADTICTACPENSFESQGECVSCGAFSLSPHASSSYDECFCPDCKVKAWHHRASDCHGSCEDPRTPCTSCQIGKFKSIFSSSLNTEKCIACPVNTFTEENGTVTCLQCPETRMTLNDESQTREDCICRAGYDPLLEDALSECGQCHLGEYKEVPGDHPCEFCTMGTFTDETGQTVCKQCRDHTSINGANTTEVDRGATSVLNCTCDQGLFLSQETTPMCVECIVGSFKHIRGFDACSFCGAEVRHLSNTLYHHYGLGESGSHTASHCKVCPPNSGFEASLVGAPPQTTMDEINDCLCFGGYERNQYTQEDGCSACFDRDPYLHRVGYGSGDCVFCSSNHYFTSSSAECQLCDLNTDTGHHSLALNSLYHGEMWGISEDDCVCDIGYYRSLFNSVQCLLCPVGKYKNELSTSTRYDCISCSLNSYANLEGTINCTICPENSITMQNNSNSIYDCLCIPGYEWNEESKLCDACSPGKFKPDLDSDSREECAVCSGTSYTDVHAATGCIDCDVNMHSELPRDGVYSCECNAGFGGDPCSKCFYGSYTAGGLFGNQHRECQECPSGTTTILNASTVIEECVCRPGHGIVGPVTTESECTLCLNGKYAPGFADVNCTFCGYGAVTFPEEGATHFDACMCNHLIGLYESK